MKIAQVHWKFNFDGFKALHSWQQPRMIFFFFHSTWLSGGSKFIPTKMLMRVLALTHENVSLNLEKFSKILMSCDGDFAQHFSWPNLCHIQTIKWKTVTRWLTHNMMFATFQLNELSLFSGWLPVLCFRFIFWEIVEILSFQVWFVSTKSVKTQKVWRQTKSFQCFSSQICEVEKFSICKPKFIFPSNFFVWSIFNVAMHNFSLH